ncbi:11562_t:CDS:2 [Funneliformis mosseae]|uniref:11562_t:CDS:1 n=1 Tax=Funneliformis mosseae TaxID=27381 RepID=A0A9N9EQS5_FUNMO|nr:11562_t:CDS:2 [Funneliformis mosseae]
MVLDIEPKQELNDLQESLVNLGQDLWKTYANLGSIAQYCKLERNMRYMCERLGLMVTMYGLKKKIDYKLEDPELETNFTITEFIPRSIKYRSQEPLSSHLTFETLRGSLHCRLRKKDFSEEIVNDGCTEVTVKALIDPKFFHGSISKTLAKKMDLYISREYGSRYPAVRDLGIGATNAGKKGMDTANFVVIDKSEYDLVLGSVWLMHTGYAVDRDQNPPWYINKPKEIEDKKGKKVDIVSHLSSVELDLEVSMEQDDKLIPEESLDKNQIVEQGLIQELCGTFGACSSISTENNVSSTDTNSSCKGSENMISDEVIPKTVPSGNDQNHVTSKTIQTNVFTKFEVSVPTTPVPSTHVSNSSSKTNPDNISITEVTNPLKAEDDLPKSPVSIPSTSSIERFPYLSLEYSESYGDRFMFNSSVPCPMCNKDHEGENLKGEWGSGIYIGERAYYLECRKAFNSGIPIVHMSVLESGSPPGVEG